jgi:hypothetical protein
MIVVTILVLVTLLLILAKHLFYDTKVSFLLFQYRFQNKLLSFIFIIVLIEVY